MPKGVPNKRYTAEFKKHVVETMLSEGLSYNEINGKNDSIIIHAVKQHFRFIQKLGKNINSNPNSAKKELLYNSFLLTPCRDDQRALTNCLSAIFDWLLFSAFTAYIAVTRIHSITFASPADQVLFVNLLHIHIFSLRKRKD